MENKMRNRDIPTLTSERLILRPFDENDLQAIYDIYSDEEVNTYLPWYPVKTLEEAEHFYKEHYSNSPDYAWAICRKEDNVPIGYVHVSMDDAHDFGYGLRKEFWHGGMVSEASAVVLDWLKKCPDIPFITATHDKNNPRSGAVMQRMGMKYQYSYDEMWQPKNFMVTFRMYQMNFDVPQEYVFEKYREIHPAFVEEI
ncbi:MAG: GNAT family N-acetyltransferase [Allobaculum sp.]